MTYKVLKARLVTGACYTGFGVVACAWGVLTVASTVIDLLRDGAAELQCWLFSHVEQTAAIAGEEPLNYDKLAIQLAQEDLDEGRG